MTVRSIIHPMPPTATLIRQNIASGDVVVLRHAATQLARRSIAVDDVLAGAAAGAVIEDYPHDEAGPAVLMLQRDAGGRPLHVIWRIAAATAGPVLLVTAYRPEPAQWNEDFRVRKR